MSKKLITLICTIVVIIFTVFLSLLAYLGNNSLTPKILDHILGLSPYVLKEVLVNINRQVDSGYSGTFVFTPNSTNNSAQLLFYAERGQTVRVTINANSIGSKPSTIRILVDKVPWGDVRELPINFVHSDITDKLKFDEPGADLHLLQVIPEKLGKDAVISLDCLVLVKNK